MVSGVKETNTDISIPASIISIQYHNKKCWTPLPDFDTQPAQASLGFRSSARSEKKVHTATPLEALTLGSSRLVLDVKAHHKVVYSHSENV